jgi:predicted MFS family arabinose efflux permease
VLPSGLWPSWSRSSWCWPRSSCRPSRALRTAPPHIRDGAATWPQWSPANGLTYLGTYVLYTYISFLLIDSGVARGWVAPTLLLFGVCGLIGLRIAAAQLDDRPRGSAILIPALMATGAGVALAYPHLAPVVMADMVWLTAFGPAASLYQSASVRTTASAPETAGAWINASSNAGIAGGAALGGVIMAELGITWVAWASTAIVAASAALALLSVSAFAPGALPARDTTA